MSTDWGNRSGFFCPDCGLVLTPWYGSATHEPIGRECANGHKWLTCDGRPIDRRDFRDLYDALKVHVADQRTPKGRRRHGPNFTDPNEHALATAIVRKCAADGHDWDVIATVEGKPLVLMCSRCQRSWAVGDEGTGPVDDHLVDLPLGEPGPPGEPPSRGQS